MNSIPVHHLWCTQIESKIRKIILNNSLCKHMVFETLKIEPCNAGPSGLSDEMTSSLRPPAEGAHCNFKIDALFTWLYGRDALPLGCYIEGRADFEWTTGLQNMMSQKVKCSNLMGMLPSGDMLSLEDTFCIHKRAVSQNITTSHLCRDQGLPLYLALALLASVDSSLPGLKSPLSNSVENLVATVVKGELVFIRVQYHPVGHDKRWIIFQPVLEVPAGKVLLFRSINS